jgi:hypothetical protein
MGPWVLIVCVMPVLVTAIYAAMPQHRSQSWSLCCAPFPNPKAYLTSARNGDNIALVVGRSRDKHGHDHIPTAMPIVGMGNGSP